MHGEVVHDPYPGAVTLGLRTRAAVAALVAALGLTLIQPGQAVGAAQPKVPGTLFAAHLEGIETGDWLAGESPVGAVRLWDGGTSWGQVEVRRGKFDWSALDKSVETARSHGASVLYVLGSTPAWAASRTRAGDYLNPGSTSMPKRLAYWREWVRAVAARYKGKIDAYQIWNEANLTTFWTGTPEQMALLTREAHRIIGKVDPRATVVSASTVPTRLTTAFNRFFARYVAALKKAEWPVDVFAGQFYPVSTGTPRDRALHIRQFRVTLDKAGAPRLPLWETEINYGIAGPGPAYPDQDITGWKAQAYVAQTYLDSMRLGVQRSYWYRWTRGPVDLLGIQMLQGEPGAVAWDVVHEWTVGLRWRGCKVDGRLISCDVGAASSSATIMWRQTGKATVPVPEGSSRMCRLDACETVAIGDRVAVGPVPVRFDSAVS